MAEAQVTGALVALLPVKVDPKAADSVDDIRKQIPKTKGLREVASAREAHFVVEVLARRTTYGVGSRHWLLVRISLGERVGRKQRQAVDWGATEWPQPRGGGGAVRDVLHSCSLKEPWWAIQEGDTGLWSSVAGDVVAGIDEFVKDNRAALTGAASGR